jgi:hypothetical protein
MTTRKSKPKPADSPLIEWPIELQLIPVTIERKTPTAAGQSRQLQPNLPAAGSLRRRSKITLH